LISPDGRPGAMEAPSTCLTGTPASLVARVSPPPSTPLSTAAPRNVARAANEAALSTPRPRCWSVRWMGEHPAPLRKADGARSASTHRPPKHQYGSLRGRLKQSESVLRQLENAGLSRK
jgi:hypothetical protein